MSSISPKGHEMVDKMFMINLILLMNKVNTNYYGLTMRKFLV